MASLKQGIGIEKQCQVFRDFDISRLSHLSVRTPERLLALVHFAIEIRVHRVLAQELGTRIEARVVTGLFWPRVLTPIPRVVVYL